VPNALEATPGSKIVPAPSLSSPAPSPLTALIHFDEQFTLAGSASGIVFLDDWQEARRMELTTVGSPIQHLSALSPHTVACVTIDRLFRVYDWRSGRNSVQVSELPDDPVDLAYDQNHTHAVLGTSIVSTYDLRAGRAEVRLNKHDHQLSLPQSYARPSSTTASSIVAFPDGFAVGNAAGGLEWL
jgi:hypothetical protein